MATKDFKIQIPTQLVRSDKFTAAEFILTAKLLQAYYSQPGKDKPLEFAIDHKAFMHYLFFKGNNTFKKALNGLHNKKIIENKIEVLPRKGGLYIKLNKVVIPEFNKQRGYFTQLPYYVLSREVIEAVGHVGVRLLYYYKSYINAKEPLKQFCFVAEATAAGHLNITEKTVIKYNKYLKTRKFIKVEQHKLKENECEYDSNGKLVFTKFNNHYFLRLDKIKEYCEEQSSSLVQIN
ncbi:hypothetical protein [Metabacillus sp. cB07]|uniref:hypothetical protein n=1 Tax=Metabacillus sp. cB07 TaxID=2806989 RepID=UPI001939F502|nr:hypothetical protein [Metabacillus sp. cB07]